jgi:PII-like signaling protein
MKSLLRIIVGEQEYNADSHNVYEYIRKLLWQKGFPGLTIRRGKLSLDYQSGMHSIMLEDVAFNNLAIIIETVADDIQIEKVKQELIEKVPHGQISVIKGMVEKEMEKNEYFVVKVYTKEDNSWFKKEKYEEVLSFLQKKKVIWATVTEGIVGYGKDRVIQKQRIFSLSQKMPIVIECIVPSEHLKDLLEELKNVVEEGAIFTTPVDMVINK